MSIAKEPLKTAQEIAPPAAPRRLGQFASKTARRFLLSEYFVLYLTLIFFVTASFFFPTLSSPANIANQLQNMWPLLAVAMGQTFVLILVCAAAQYLKRDAPVPVHH